MSDTKAKKFAKPGPLESLQARGLKDQCEMCGRTERRRGAAQPESAHVEPAFSPSGKPMTMCRDCRIGSLELLAEELKKFKSFVSLVARMKTEEEYGDDGPDSEDYISTLNDLIEKARKVIA